MTADARALVARLLEDAPPLSQRQRDRLATLLHSGATRARTNAGGERAPRNVA
jgi:hypothetical protein